MTGLGLVVMQKCSIILAMPMRLLVSCRED